MSGRLPAAAWLLAPVAFAASTALAGRVRRYAIAHQLLDRPNERSSHLTPTPRGGGLAIVAVVLAGLLVLAALGAIDLRLALALGGGGGLVAAFGWRDDRRGSGALVRLAAQIAAAAWALAWLGGMPDLTVGERAVYLGPAGAALGALGIVWAANLYNFMDGIDGLAAGEAVTVGAAAAALTAGAAPGVGAVALLTAAAAAGFLRLNWPPARLFMGDVGSGFLGFTFATLAVAGERGGFPALLWLLLLGPFVGDATVTLLRRLWRGDPWYSPHRTHAYQRAALAGWSHLRVTLAVLGINIPLFILAALALRRPAVLPAALAAGGLVVGIVYLLVERVRPMRAR